MRLPPVAARARDGEEVIGMLTPIVRETVRNGNRIIPSDFRRDPRGTDSAMTGAQPMERFDVSAR